MKFQIRDSTRRDSSHLQTETIRTAATRVRQHRATAAAAASEHQQIPSLRCKDKSPTPAPIMQMWYLELLRSSNHEVSDPRFSDKTIRSVIIEGSATSTAAVAFLCPHRTLTHRLRCTYWTDVLLSFSRPPSPNSVVQTLTQSNDKGRGVSRGDFRLHRLG